MSRSSTTKNILVRALAGKEGGRTLYQILTGKKSGRVDKDFPLNLRIHARVKLDLTPYYLAEGKLAMSLPAGTGTISAIGVIRHGDDMVDYMVRIAPDSVEENKTTLLLVETMGGEVSAKIFTQAHEVFPQSERDWAAWLDAPEGIIGIRYLTSPDNGPVYERVWGNGDYVDPMDVSEELITNGSGENTKVNDLLEMMYARDVTGDGGAKLTEEYALVMAINEERIVIFLGVPITLVEGNIIG